MTLFGKDYKDIEVLSCEFMTFNGLLYILVADVTQKLHILQYDPEDPTSLSGQKLIRKSEFFSGREITVMALAPLSLSQEDSFVPLCGASDGSLSVVVPVSESDYRALYVMQQQISEKEEHNASLNPRMHRNLGVDVGAAGVAASGRALLDYEVIKRFQDLTVAKQESYSKRIGKNGTYDTWRSLCFVEECLNYL